MTASPASFQVAVVTGAARGIGLAITDWFLARGWRVAMLDIDRATLSQSAPQRQPGDAVLALGCDVSSADEVAAASQAVLARFGRVDALVNNAGVASFQPLLDTSFATWREIMATNLDGPFLCTQALAPAMIEGGGGAVVNIASISGLRASTLRVAYGTSKAALIHLTRQQAVELGDRGVRVNAIAPGPVDTEMAKQVHTAAIRAEYHATIPLARYGTPEEIAAAVGWLCGPEASYVNGQVLAVDGGFDAAGVGLTALREAGR